MWLLYDFCRYYKQQQELLNAWKNTPFQNGYGGVPNYAYATGAYGPNGIQQTAGVFPPNKVSHALCRWNGVYDEISKNIIVTCSFFFINHAFSITKSSLLLQNKPNLDNRFDPNEASPGSAPSGSFFGVSTSSFSSSSDINGVKKHKEAASTTINDNGKVSTYTVDNWCALTFRKLWWHMRFSLASYI